MLYHKDIGFPGTLKIPRKMVNLWYSGHAKQRIKGKYKRNLVLPSFINLNKDNIIEVSTKNNINCDKILVRIRYDKKRDICVVMVPKNGKVITIWTNYKKDKHDTLDKSKYNKP